jgi:hypothetical protein
MASRGDIPATAGAASFRISHWTQIVRARTLDPERKQEALGAVLAEYWRPVYYDLRRKGLGHDRAEDLTQEFFEEVVLGRDLVPRADRAKGRFRNLPLVALERYVRSVGRAEGAWNRLVQVRIDDGDGALDSGDTLVATHRYDGQGRRVSKTVDNAADWDCTYHYTYDTSWRRIADSTLKRNRGRKWHRKGWFGKLFVDPSNPEPGALRCTDAILPWRSGRF